MRVKPRWEFMRRREISDHRGGVYLRRWTLLETPWFAFYLHKMLGPDADRWLHDHPFRFLSVVLRGGYDEEVHAEGNEERVRWFSVKGSSTFHRIVRLHRRPTWTLVLRGRRHKEWGFLTPNGWQAHHETLGLQEGEDSYL